ncbi:PorP/SprF family type IX secretion system membrane protein [Gaoshiqia sp. Z1-71]|uniref:PorP/SprF family type IX secretion system membrane protein n=1 Tax=Gaoshiqia hydrogeniformans TaxID=3290090 RepID=UPI003BF8B197
MKKKWFLLVFMLVNLAASAQQDPQFSFNKLTQLTINPGFAGNSGAVSGLILNRYQWTGIEGAPETLVFSVEASTGLFGGNDGIGLNIISDKLGFEKNILVNFNYAHIVQTSLGNLGLGASFGVFNKAINGDWYIPESSYHVNPGSDGLIPNGSVSQLAFDVGFGLFLKSKDYFAGFSVTHLNQAKVEFSDMAYTFYTRHYYLNAGYGFKMSDPSFVLQPSVFVKTDLAGTQIDLSADLIFKDRFRTGLGYRLDDAVILFVGVELLNGLNVGYSYDLVVSALGRYSSGSHEMFLYYSFDLKKSREKRYKSVRYL